MAVSTIPTTERSAQYGTVQSIIGYNSSSNRFTPSRDGYIMIQVWNSNSNVDLWIGADAVKIPITYSGLTAYALYAKKGCSYWFGVAVVAGV